MSHVNNPFRENPWTIQIRYTQTGNIWTKRKAKLGKLLLPLATLLVTY